MLKKIFKWIFIVLGGLIGLALIFYVVIYFKTSSRIDKQYSVHVQTLVIPSDSASYARGKHIAANRGCMGCHGHDLGGGIPFMDEKSPLGILYSANITSGKGGIKFTDEDWIRVLRNGLDQNNHSIWFMPSQNIYGLSNQDMRDMISYVKNQPPVDRIVPARSLKPLGRILVFANKYPLLVAELINQNAVFVDSVETTISATYGHYLSTICQGCHGPLLKGNPPHKPNEPNIPNLTSTGDLGKWTSGDFTKALHTGIKPDGKELNPAMPWKDLSFTDDELKSIFIYIQSIK